MIVAVQAIEAVRIKLSGVNANLRDEVSRDGVGIRGHCQLKRRDS
jgi:hypothetical protein